MQEEIGQILRLQGSLLKHLKAFAEREITSKNLPQKNLPFEEYLKLLQSNWESIAKRKGLGKSEKLQIKDLFFETVMVRNRYAHPDLKEKESLDFVKDCQTLYQFAQAIEASPEVISQIDRYRNTILSKLSLDSSQVKTGSDPENKVSHSEKKKKKKKKFKELSIKKSRMVAHFWDDDSLEKDVLSVAAEVTLHIIKKTKVHSCPNQPREKESAEEWARKYNYKNTKHISFRSIKGQMDTLYKIQKILITDLKRKDDMEGLIEEALKQNVLDGKEVNRLKAYFNDNPFTGNERIYILDEDNVVDLPHLPAPGGNSLLPLYFSLSEILSGRKVILPDLNIVS